MLHGKIFEHWGIPQTLNSLLTLVPAALCFYQYTGYQYCWSIRKRFTSTSTDSAASNVDAVPRPACQGLMDSARHVIGCHLPSSLSDEGSICV